MLVSTRKLGERIVMGEGIVVEVVAIQGGRVRLGITCPDEVPVLRSEVTNPQAGLTMPTDEPRVTVRQRRLKAKSH